MGRFAERGLRIAHDRHRLRAAHTRLFDGGNRKRSASAGGNADHDIFIVGLLVGDRLATHSAGVLVRLHGRAQRFWAPGNDELDHAWVDIKSRRTFDGVKRGNTSAGTSTDVDEASATGESRRDQIDRLRDLWKGTLHR